MSWWEILLPVIGSLFGAGVRHWLSERTWSKVRDAARVIAGDENATNDALEAVELALIQVQLDRLYIEAKKVAAAFVVNGSNPVPRLNVKITEGKE